jgi:hypothetical protein
MSEFHPGDILTKGRYRWVLKRRSFSGSIMWRCHFEKANRKGVWSWYSADDLDPAMLIAEGYEHTRPVKHEKPKESETPSVVVVRVNGRFADTWRMEKGFGGWVIDATACVEPKVPEPTSKEVDDAIGEFKAHDKPTVYFSNRDGFLNTSCGTPVGYAGRASAWTYDASKCCGPLSGTSTTAEQFTDILKGAPKHPRDNEPAPAPPKLPDLPTPPVDEPWFDGLLWTEYLTYWHKRQAEVAVLPLPIPDRDTFSSVGYHVQTFADWLDSKKNVDHHNKKHAEYIAKETAARVAYVKSVQAARKPKAKGGGK